MPNNDKIQWPQGEPQFELHWRAIAESLGGNGIVNFGDLEVTTTSNNLEIEVASGNVFYVGQLYNHSSATTFTLSSGDSTNDRWDTVYFDTSTESAGVREGNAASKPEPPDIQEDEILLASIYVPATATKIDNEQILNWRTHSTDADNTYLKDSQDNFNSDTVESAFTEVIRKQGDPLNGPINLSSFSGLAPFNLGEDPGNFGQIVDATATDSLTAGDPISYTFAIDSNSLLGFMAQSDGNGGIENSQVNIIDSDLFAGTDQIYDSTAGNILQNVLGGPASELTRYPLPLSEDTNMDVEGTDLTDSSGPGTLYSSNEGLFVRNVIDVKKSVHGPVTSNYTTSGEEVITVDTSNGEVTITLSSADTEQGNFITIVDAGGNAGTNGISITTENSEMIDGSQTRVIQKDYKAFILFSPNGSNWLTASGTASASGISIEDNGSTVLNPASIINFGNDLTATDNGDGSVTVDSDAAGVNVLTTGTFTHTGGSASSNTITGVTTDETANLYVEVGVDSDPGFDADYAWSYTWSEGWNDANQQVDVTIDATWDTDPTSGNDVDLDYRIYTMDVSVSKSQIQNLVDSPNGNIPTALLEDGESIEISVPVSDGEQLKIYRWGAYLISDGTTPSGLELQLLDGNDVVQQSEVTSDTESLTTPVTSYGNATGSTSIFKLRISNGTGTDYDTDGIGGFFAYVVE